MSEILDFGDPRAAILDHIANHPLVMGGIAALEIVGVDPGHILGRRVQDSDVEMPGDYITATLPPGPSQREAWERRVRVDVWCYGKNNVRATDVNRLVNAALLPAPPDPTGFDRAGSNVVDVNAESGVSLRRDPQDGWPVAMQTFILTIRAKQIEV